MIIIPGYLKSRKGIRLLSQYDPRWAQLKLGPSNLTMGRYGCTTTALAALYGKTPEEMEKMLKYTKDGLVIWQSLEGFKARRYGYSEAELKEWYKDPKNVAVIEVNRSHWVALDRFAFGPLGMDPWGGQWINILRKYKNITGYALSTRK